MKLAAVIKKERGFRVRGIYRISRFELKTAKTGKRYGDCVISDSSADIPAKYWDIEEEQASALTGHIILSVTGVLDFYKEAPQLTITAVAVPSDEERTAALRDLGLTSKRDRKDMADCLDRLIESVQRDDLQRLLRHVFSGSDGFSASFLRHPGAVWNHHAWIGGLAEHTLEVAELADMYCQRNRGVDRDILLAAALLHDIGKVNEIETDSLGLPLGFTAEGKLLRHIYLGMEHVEQACRQVGASTETALIIKHCILSHHGQPEWGSPVEPMMMEAELLHYLDNISAKTDMFSRESERTAPGGFTRSQTLKRDIYRPEME